MRFNELKKAPSEIQEVDGEVVDANKIETALRTAGIALRDTNGEIRNTDEVLFELSSKWNTLDKNTRAYIATMAAGSRQQSRFIAMVSDYARLSQLEEEAINSAGASGKQFEKTLESMEAKVQNLQNQVDTFLTQIMNSGFLKFLIDAGKYLTEFANKLTSLPGILGSISKVGLGFGIFKGGAKLVDTIFRSFTQNGKQFSGLGARIGGNIFMGIKSFFHKGKVGLQNAFGKAFDLKAVIEKNTTKMNMYSASVAELNRKLKAGAISQELYEQQLKESAGAYGINIVNAEAYNGVIAQGLGIKGSDLILQDEQVASDTLEILSTQGLTKAKKKEMIQETINQKLKEKGLVLEQRSLFFKMKNYFALMFGSKATREQTIALLGYKTASEGAANATNLFSKAIYKIPFLGWILLVIAALVSLISIIVACTRTTQKSIDNADKAAERATSRMQELSNEIEGLADTFSKIQDLGDSFDDLTKGSVEWTSKLIENNQYLEDLVDKYEILQDYLAYDENGIAYFKEGYENALVNELQNQYEEQRTSKIANEYDAARLRYQKGEISYQDYVSAQSAYISQGIRSKANDDASIAAANLTSIKFGSEYEKVWDEQEKALKDLAREGSGFTTYNNDTLKDLGEKLGLWYLKDGDIYNDKDFQEELDLNEDDMAERIIRSNTLTAIQKNTKDTADRLRQQDKFTQKIASGNWKSITAKDLQEHGVSNPKEARDQLEASYSENDPENWLAWLRITNSDVEELINRFSANSALDNDASSMLKYLWMYDNIKDDREEINGGLSPSKATLATLFGLDVEDISDEDLHNAYSFDFNAITGEAQGKLDNMFNWAASLGLTNFNDAFSAYNSLDKKSQDLLADPDFQNSIYEYSKEFGSGVSAALSLYLSANGGMESDFAKILSDYANSGLKNLDEAFKGLDITTNASVDDILNFIQVQRNLGNETSILTDNFIKLTEGMTISQEKLQEWYQIINKGARITEGKTGYDTYSKDEIDILKDTMAISSDDILRVGEDQYKVINKTAEQITHYLGSWNAKISGVNKGSENNLKFVSMLANENDDNRDQFKKTGSEEGRDLKFGTQENQDIYQVAKGIHEAGGVGVVSDEEAKTGLGAGQMSMTDAKTAYKRLLFQQQVLANNITDEEEATKLWNKIDAQVNREMVSPEAIQQALNGFISENYYESVEDYEAAQNANFLLDAGESGYRSDTSRDKMYNSSSEAMRETAQKAAQLVVNERNLNGVVQMVTSTVSKQNPSLAKNSDLMKELAIAISDAQNGFETIRSVISDCEEDLKDFGSIKYYQAIDKIAQAFQNMGIMEADSAWVGANLEDIMDFYNGSASAADRLYKNLVKIKLAQMDNTELASQLQTVINGLTFDTEGIGTFTETANAMLTALVGATGENMSDIEQIFKSFGVDLEYIYGADGKITGVKAVNQFKVGANYNKREAQKENSSNKWENSYDWLYNLTQKINEELRIREKLEKRYDRILNNRRMNEKDVIAAREKELQSLMKELNLQTEMYEKRRGEISAILRDNKDLTKYATYDFENNMVQINWDKINKVSDETLGGRIETFIEKLENAESEFEDAFDSIEDIYDTVQDIYDDSRQNYLDFENRVLEAVVNQYQLEIDRLTEIDNSINDSNSKLLDSIQKSIDEQRQARQNTETEENLTDKLNQLLYKQQDKTSSLTDLKTLEKELEDSRQDYIDTLIDQKISELQEQNDEAAEQRQRQIELMEGQLEQAKDQGLLWDEVNLILKEGIYGPDGQINQNSKLVQILQELDKYNSLSEEGKKNWLDELSVQYKQYEEFGKLKGLLSENLNTIGTRLENLGSQLNTLDWTIKATGDKIVQGYRSSNQDGDENIEEKAILRIEALIKSGQTTEAVRNLNDWLEKKIITNETYKKLLKEVLSSMTIVSGGKNSAVAKNEYKAIFATGGLADFTGPAWLDGTKSRPELVLNPRDTENFIQLKDILSSIMSNNIPTITEGARTANSNFEININVDSISSDYDVDRLVERVKKDIVEDSSYRNPVVLNLLR
ncbi:MAG: phage tail tape measure protein [Treponema sp.]|nr:phage tail tape measure protein [Treponema sp.]